jgi:hypothetical protein
MLALCPSVDNRLLVTFLVFGLLVVGVPAGVQLGGHVSTTKLRDLDDPTPHENYVEGAVFTLQACGSQDNTGPKAIWPNSIIEASEDLWIFSASAKPRMGDENGQAMQLKMIAFVLEKHPRYMYDHCMTSNRSAALLKDMSCIFGEEKTKLHVHVEEVQDEDDVMGPYDKNAEDDPPKFQGAIELKCAVPESSAKQMRENSVTPLVVGLLERGGERLLDVSLCGSSSDSSDVDMDLGGKEEVKMLGFCLQPFRNGNGKGKGGEGGESGKDGEGGEGGKGGEGGLLSNSTLQMMKEWIVYHHYLMGVGHFYLYDRDAHLLESLQVINSSQQVASAVLIVLSSSDCSSSASTANDLTNTGLHT